MGKEDIKREIYKLRRERDKLEMECFSIGRQLPLWLSIRYIKCWKKNCKCMKGKGHGPYSYVSFKYAGKVHYRYLSPEKLNKLRKYIDNYRSFEEKITALNKIHQRIIFLLKEHQKNNLLRIPKWLKEKKKV